MAGEVVLITGGSGFLGQHIVRMIQEHQPEVAEIRVLDTRPYIKALDHKESIPVKSIVGDITRFSDVDEALKGVHTVIHTAGLISFGTFPDYEGMEKVNVTGTNNVINGCVSQNVERLVYTSTIDVVVGYDEIVDGDESTPIPSQYLFPGYPETKYRAETAVISADKTPINKGKFKALKTLVLRPNVMYGEGDPYYVTNALKSAHERGGVLTRVGDGSALFQQAYVGNMAWAHVKAAQALKDNPDCSGHVYFITDDTPVVNAFDFLEPFLKARSCRLSARSIPYSLVYGIMYVLEKALRIIRPIKEINLPTPLCSLIYMNLTLYYNRNKAEEMLDYRPIFSANEALERSIEYYASLEF